MEKVTVTMTKTMECSFSLPKDTYEKHFKKQYDNLKTQGDEMSLYHEMLNTTYEMPEEVFQSCHMEVA